MEPLVFCFFTCQSIETDDYSVRTIKPIGISQELTCTKPSDNNNEGI